MLSFLGMGDEEHKKGKDIEDDEYDNKKKDEDIAMDSMEITDDNLQQQQEQQLVIISLVTWLAEEMLVRELAISLASWLGLT
jgi:hypothetical protein